MRPVSGSDYAGLSRPGKSETPGQIFSDGSSRGAGDPCCCLGFNKAEIVLIYNLISIYERFIIIDILIIIICFAIHECISPFIIKPLIFSQ